MPKFKLGQKGIVPFVVLLILGIGLIVGLYLVQHPAIFNPHAQEFVNPASANCEQKGGTIDLRTAPSGAQYGICKFNDGTECEEWAFMNGTCRPGQYQVWEENENKKPDLSFNFYAIGFTETKTDQTSPSPRVQNTWTDQNKAKYLFLGMTIHNSSNFSSTDKGTTLKIKGDVNKEVAIPVLRPGAYSQQIPLYIPLPASNNILKISINADKAITESDYYNNYVFVSLRDGTTLTEREPSGQVFGFEKLIAEQLTCDDLKLINRLSDSPACIPEPSPTATTQPKGPIQLRVSNDCSSNPATGHLTWTDTNTSENQFNLLQDGIPITSTYGFSFNRSFDLSETHYWSVKSLSGITSNRVTLSCGTQ